MAARRAGESAQGIDADLCIFRTDVEFCEDLEDVEIISLDSNKAEVALAVSITFRADLSYKVPSTGAWDGEDRVLVFQDETNATVEQDIESTIGVEVGFKNLDHQSFKVKRVWFEGDQNIEVYANHFDGV